MKSIFTTILPFFCVIFLFSCSNEHTNEYPVNSILASNRMTYDIISSTDVPAMDDFLFTIPIVTTKSIDNVKDLCFYCDGEKIVFDNMTEPKLWKEVQSGSADNLHIYTMEIYLTKLQVSDILHFDRMTCTLITTAGELYDIVLPVNCTVHYLYHPSEFIANVYYYYSDYQNDCYEIRYRLLPGINLDGSRIKSYSSPDLDRYDVIDAYLEYEVTGERWALDEAVINGMFTEYYLVFKMKPRESYSICSANLLLTLENEYGQYSFMSSPGGVSWSASTDHILKNLTCP